MSTPFQGITDNIAPDSVLPLDYSFLNFALSNKEQQYESGISQVRSSYNSVLNSQVTNPENQQVKEQYLSQAKQKIQELSKADLSLPQNVAKASQIFAPFWNDPDMVSDMYKTKQIQSSLQEANTAKTSKDDNVRAGFDSRIIPYLNQPYMDLKQAHRGDGSIQDISPRQYTPFKDVKKYLDDEAKNEDLEISWYDDPMDNKGNFKSPYLIKHTNGERSVQNFTDWAASKLGDEFNDQFNIIGTVKKEARVNQYMEMGMTKPDAERRVGNELYYPIAQTYSDNLKYYKDTKASVDNDIANFQNVIKAQKDQKMTPEQMNHMDDLLSKKQTLDSNIKNLEPTLNDFMKLDSREDFIAHPENQLARSTREQLIHDWANGRASNENINISTNQAYFDAKNLQMRGAELNEKIRFDNMENANKQLENRIKGFEAGMFDINGNPVNPNNQINGQVAGSATSLLEKVPADQLYYNMLSRVRGEAYTEMFNPSGLVSSLKSLPGVTNDDIKNVNTYLYNKAQGKNVEYTPDMNNSFVKVKEGLKTKGINITTAKNDLDAYRDAILQYIPKYIDDMKNMGKGDEVARMGTMLGIVNRNLDFYNNQETIRQQNVHKAIESGQFGNSPLIVDRHGVKDIATPDDLAHDFPTIQLGDDNGNPIRTLSSKEFAKEYLQGQVKYNGGTDNNITIDGKPYNILAVNNKVQGTWDRPASVDLSDILQGTAGNKNSIEGKYGKSADLKKQYDKILDAGIPDAQHWKNNTGQLMMKRRYGFEKNGLGPQLVMALGDPSNSNKIYTSESMAPGTEITAKEQVALSRKASTVQNAKDYFSEPIIVGAGPTQGSVGMIAIADNGKKEAQNDPDLKELAGKTFYVDIKPDSRNEALKKVEPATRYFFQNPQLLMGRTVTSSPAEEAAGYKYSITPNMSTNPTGATVNIESTTTDPHTGKPHVERYERYSNWEDFSPNAQQEAVDMGRGQHYRNYATNSAKRRTIGATGPTLSEYLKSRGLE